MKMMRAGLALLLSTGIAASAQSQVPNPTQEPPTGAAQPAAKIDRNDPNRVLCRKQQVQGSGLLPRSKKVCKPKAEWDAEDRQSEEEV